MFFCAAIVIALMRDCRDDRGLVVVPSMGGDSGAFADADTPEDYEEMLRRP